MSFRMVFHSVAELQTRLLVSSYSVDSLQWSVGKACMVHSVWITELKIWIFIINIRVWRELPEETTNSIWIDSIIWIRWDRLWVWRELLLATTNSIMHWINHLDPVWSIEINCKCVLGDSIGTGWSVWPSWDRVSISPRSCVDFAWSAQVEIRLERSSRFHRVRVSIYL